jgi:hypothetical protein
LAIRRSPRQSSSSVCPNSYPHAQSLC